MLNNIFIRFSRELWCSRAILVNNIWVSLLTELLASSGWYRSYNVNCKILSQTWAIYIARYLDTAADCKISGVSIRMQDIWMQHQIVRHLGIASGCELYEYSRNPEFLYNITLFKCPLLIQFSMTYGNSKNVQPVV